jgi:hypothetical protein
MSNREGQKLREALGIGPDDVVHVTGSPHEREPHMITPPDAPKSFDRLRTMTRAELHRWGLRMWSEESGLMLFPAEWYDRIPEGFEIVTINEVTKRFERGVTDDDRRFGLLAFGIVVVKP